MTQSLDVQLHSWSLLSHLSNKGNFGARVLFKLCYIKGRKIFFSNKGDFGARVLFELCDIKARRKFSNKGNIEIQRHHKAAICFIRYV